MESWPTQTPGVGTRREHRIETHFGLTVSDPYRWLEDGTNPEVDAWVTRQNQLTRQRLSAVPGRGALARRIAELLEIGSISVPIVKKTRAGKLRLFYTRRDAKQNHPVLYTRDGPDGADRVLVNPNELGGSEHTTALDWYYPSEEGDLLAYGMSDHGTEDSVLRILDVERGRMLTDTIPDTRHASVAWIPGGRGFFAWEAAPD